jgi:hypothetical protein
MIIIEKVAAAGKKSESADNALRFNWLKQPLPSPASAARG